MTNLHKQRGIKMPTYTFKVDAAASVWAETEEEARNAFIRSCQEQDEDVQYGELGIYIPSYSTLVLTDVYEE